MITLSKSGGTVTFTFDDNSTYLQNGTIEVPLNSLSLIIDESGMATFRKSASNDIFISALYSEFGMSKAELEAWYKENMVGSAGIDSGAVQTQIDESISGKADTSAVTESINAAVSGKADTSALTVYFDDVEYDSSAKTINFYNDGVLKDSIDASDFVIDGMVDDVRIETISGASYLVIDFNTASGKEDIQIPLSDIFNPDNYYDKTAIDGIVSGLNEDIATKLDASAYTPTDLSQYWTSAQTESAITEAVSGKADTSALDDYVTKASNVSSGYTSTLEINKYDMFNSIDDVSDFYVSGNSQCSELYVEYGIEDESCCYSVMFDFQNIPTFEQNYVVAEYDSTTRTYHIRNTSLDYPLFNNIRCSSYAGDWNADFKIWSYSIKIPSGQTADVLDNTIPYLLDEINAKPSTSDIPSMCEIYASNRNNLELAFKNSNYYYLFTSNLGVSNGIVANANTLSTEVVLDAEYKWMDCPINDGCESDNFNSESSAITFDMSRNPTDFISVKFANGEGLSVIGSNGENLNPQEFSVVIDNGHVTITSLRNYRIYGLMDNDCELDQYVSNLKYWGYETGTIQDAYDKLNGSLSGKVDSSSVVTAVTSASTDSEIPTAKAVFDAIPTGGTGGLDTDTERLLSTAINDLNDRKIDASEVKANYQKKGDYATKSELAAKANASEVMTLEKAKENELVTATALNSINERLIALEAAVQALQALHINE